jgi:tetratricopeptide (TPR) repeat protein
MALHRKSSPVVRILTSAENPSQSVLWNCVATLLSDGMKPSVGLAGAVAMINPAIAAPVIALAVVCGVARYISSRRDAARDQEMHDQIRTLAEKAARGADVIREIADGTIELKVDLDGLVKRDIAAVVAERLGQPGSELREAISDEFEKAISSHPEATEILRSLRELIDKTEELRILAWTNDARGREQSDDLKKILAFIESQKQPGTDPTKQTVPPDVLAAAHELIKSKDARKRAQAAIVLRQWDDWKREIDALNSSAATDMVFQNKTIEGDGFYAQGKFDEAVGPYEVAFRLREYSVDARTNLARTLVFSRRGNRSDRLRRAIDLMDETLRLPELSRKHWARSQIILGLSWADMPTGDREANVTQAIRCYEEALKEYTRAAAPMNWATTQNNLGNAWLQLPTGDRTSNLIRAINCYGEALKERTRAAAPMDWAVTQHNLGQAWSDMPTGDRATNQNRAIMCFEEALKEYTPSVAPMEWASTQNSLGIAWARMPNGDVAANLNRAIGCYQDALKEWTRAAAPMDWASTQNNLGNAWARMPTGDRAGSLNRAIECYEEALKERTRNAAPMKWAATQNNLGLAWSEMPTGGRATNQNRAIVCFQEALKEYTRTAAPRGWAMTQYNLANAIAKLAEQPGQDERMLLRWAISCGKAARLVYTDGAFPTEHAKTSKNLKIDRSRYEELGCDRGPGGVAFDDIAPAE